MLGPRLERLHTVDAWHPYRGPSVYSVDIQDGGQASTMLGVDPQHKGVCTPNIVDTWDVDVEVDVTRNYSAVYCVRG